MKNLLVLLIATAALSCQAGSPTSGDLALAQWDDIPVPRGFEPVDTVASEAAASVGEFRHGDFLLRGPGSARETEAYYAERLPQHGWHWDESLHWWTKRQWRLSVDITDSVKEGYQESQVLLKVRSMRAKPGQS